MKDLSSKLRAVLLSKGLKVADVQRMLPEYSAATVGHWFNGRRQPLMDNLRRLCEVLDVRLADLVSDTVELAATPQERLALELLRDLPPEKREAAIAMLKVLGK